MSPKTEQKLHYFLIAGKVIFSVNDGKEGQVAVIDLNTVVKSDAPELRMHTIGKAQQSLQILAAQKLGNDVKITVVDVVISGAIYCGFLTESEFSAVPEGYALKERPTLKVVAGNDDAE